MALLLIFWKYSELATHKDKNKQECDALIWNQSFWLSLHLHVSSGVKCYAASNVFDSLEIGEMASFPFQLQPPPMMREPDSMHQKEKISFEK